jgi:GMP synthase (glutamine-hydrolysing)
MNILIVDGNEKNASNKYTEMGMPTQFEIYENVLRSLVHSDIKITILHPACLDNYIPQGVNLDDFHGIVWTGSVLNIYDLGPSIERQIELAKELFNKKNKIFGSCWGLQVLTMAAGGTVRKNPKGLEAVIAKNIVINSHGIEHPLYKDKPKVFDSFCWHYDEVESLPSDAQVLSSNDKSSIQSIAFSKKKSEIWAVQYHPEFNPKWISGLMKQRESILLEEGVYPNSEKFNQLCTFLSNIEKYKDKKNQLSISDTIVKRDIHTIELSNWLRSFKNDI